MARTGTNAHSTLDFEARTETVFSWIRDHTRAIGMAAAAIVVLAAGSWLYLRTRANQETRATDSLGRAAQSIEAGNPALAQSDLERLVRRYPDTYAGRQAVLLLSEVLFSAGKYQQGITELERAAAVSDDQGVAATAEAQIGAGYEEMKKYGEAATHYEKAATKARFQTDKLLFRASAARAHTNAGNKDAAIKIWSELAADETSPVAGEARIRLGELKARVARQS
ncbi:MAG: tetratricopeptide repeat protein [Gemmatimonadaceae bacterium]